MSVLLLQLDGKQPNIALMRISAFHKKRGDEVELRRIVRPEGVDRGFFDDHDYVYASTIFSKTRPVAERLLEVRPDAIIGGTGWNIYTEPRRIPTLEEYGIFTKELDYSLYPYFNRSIGYTQRGCRMNERTCSFCAVPILEGKVRAVATVEELWRKTYYDPVLKQTVEAPRELLLLDNDPFGQPGWRDLIAAIREGDFKVCFNQGINARMLNDETAAAIASIKFRDDDFKTKRIYTAWDSRGDERVLFRGLDALVRHGVTPDQIMVYMIIGYDHERKEARPFLIEDDFYRREALRAYGCRPYPMPFIRNKEMLGFQRWIIGAYDKRISWGAWEKADYQPNRLGQRDAPRLFDEELETEAT